jgi:hypothetical protein
MAEFLSEIEARHDTNTKSIEVGAIGGSTVLVFGF